ncbi:FG-GAP-like repeat-containing protein [Flagellimonas sp.]|uniref:FG-GAP-like repeat-containing protein n=1 Tax=Flagellimonas sp. TaxID=2058762 RepID=UPI003B50473D
MIKDIGAMTLLGVILSLGSCSGPNEQQLFQQLSPKHTGITFSNNLRETDTLNYFLYKYMYMGGGVAIGDLNNDGLQDIYFTGNMVDNKLYLNDGGLKFKDITDQAGVAGEKVRWVTGVTMADVNADGKLDIYVSIAGLTGNKKNLLYINNTKDGQIPMFKESAEEYGIADNGNSVQSVFFDYDLDGDLDLYVANYPITDTNTGIYNYREYMKYAGHVRSDHLYRNDNGKFIDVTIDAGMLSFGLSLGLAVGDYNQDGWPDLYVSNDFAVPDYFFFNNGDGTFTNKLEEVTNHTAFFGMGADAADFNNDGRLDMIQVDMTPEDNFKSKANMASMNTELFRVMVANGMHYQYMQNALQMNMGNNPQGLPQFAEVSRLVNASLTDWSWAPLFADLDNDGWKDIFITNGSRREINHKDFFKQMNKDKDQALHYVDWVEKMPEERVENFALKNKGGLSFDPIAKEWGINFKGWSNGAAYADLDNDGDLELVVNNIDDKSILYKNNTVENGSGNYLRIKLNGPPKNRFGFGTKIVLEQQEGIQYQECMVTRGFQSSVETMVHFGLGQKQKVEKATIIWPDGKQQQLANIEANQVLVVDHRNAVPIIKKQQNTPELLFTDITEKSKIDHKHVENVFDDFKHQVLLPHKMSQFGPALAVGDTNGDGLEDFFVGGAKGYQGEIYTQLKSGSFQRMKVQALADDRIHEDVDAAFLDIDNDNDLDLYVVSGGNEHEKGHDFYRDRLYLNDGKGGFTKSRNALPYMLESGAVVRAADIDEDGDLDLFIGTRLLPRNYPLSGKSYLLRNETVNGRIKFVDITSELGVEAHNLGMVTDADWADINGDSLLDLIVTGEWMPVTVFENKGGTFKNMGDMTNVNDESGWWNCLLTRDFDNDGDMDLIAGNLGENYKYKASREEPFSIYMSDYDKNNKNDIVLSYVQNGEEFPLRGRQCSSEQIPAIAIKFKDYNSFARATLAEVYTEKSLEESVKYQAVNFSTSYFENDGQGHFTIKPMERMVQTSSVNAIYAGDVTGSGCLDLVMGGNLYESEVETPRNDASHGLFLIGNGHGDFKGLMPYKSGLMVKGEVRRIKEIKLANGSKGLIFAINEDSLKIEQLPD